MDMGSREDRIVAAGEYVLGLLTPAEAQEFERALVSHAEVREELRFWEQRFAGLGLRLKPAAPRPMVWLDIQQRIASSNVTPIRKDAAPSRLTTTWASLATAAAVLLGVGLAFQLQQGPPAPVVVKERVPVPVPAVSYVALLKMPEGDMQWSVSVTPDRKEVVVRASGTPPAAAKNLDAELWLITDGGPVSLGVIPKTGEVRNAYRSELAFASGKTLAVSLEPIGGSPTGSPTGPVVTSGTVLQAG